MNYVRRFVFVHYRDLLTLRLKKLEKVSDKLYVFTPATVAQVPLGLVRQLQRMGPDLEWIDLGDVARADAASIIGFHVGVLHERVDLGVEFAVLSDDPALDALVAHVESSGRSCVRVRQQSGKPAGSPSARPPATEDREFEEDADAEFDLVDLDDEVGGDGGAGTLTRPRLEPLRAEALQQRRPGGANGSPKGGGSLRERLGAPLPPVSRNGSANGSALAEQESRADAGEQDVGATVASLADELVRRLIRSGNRPEDLSMLRSYILLYVEEPGSAAHVDNIIAHMAEKGEIKVDAGEVSYNF